MSLFSKSKVVLWPKDDSLEIYLDQSDNNTFSFETDLWQEQNDENLANLANFFKQNKISEVNVLLNDTYVITKTFIYDSVVTKLDPNEVITLAKDSIDFKISPESVTFDLESENNRTLVRTRIFNQDKFQVLTGNLQKLGLKVLDFETVSSSVIKLYTNFDAGQYFFFYPINNHDYVAILSNKGHVYLTSIIKKALPELKKLLNYASAYFSNKEPVQYLPGTNYNEVEICQSFHKASNLPLPVLSFFVGNSKPAIIKPVSVPTPTPTTPVSSIIDSTPKPLPTMENNKKSLLPIIAVFIITAIVASVIVWFILNQNKNTENNTPGGENQVEDITNAPIITQEPTPTLVEISKTLKIQVLNATEINGQAATIKTELTKLGFTSVATGNSKETATSNQIQLKSTIAPDYFLQNITEFASATTSELAATSTYDVVFIIGVDLKTGSTASPAATAAPTTVSTPSASPTISN
ncbi:MAG: LytR C-terminal domain-containing protein [Candidatus Shapirobacteria bacterium]